MKIGSVSLLVVCMAMPAYAEIYHAGSKCKPLQAHSPDANVEAKPGMDQHGRAVAPADINAPPMDTEALKNPPIALNLPIDAYLKTDAYNADLSRAEIQLGTISQGEHGGVNLNNEVLSTSPQAVYPEYCQ